MPTFTTAVNSPAMQAVIQKGLLVREFKDALFPKLLYRGEAVPGEHPVHVGDELFFTGKGLLPRNVAPLAPGQDPVPQTYPIEQWRTQLQKYAGTMDTPMPSAIVAIVKLFMENVKQLGLQAGQSLNTGARDQAYNAAMSGWTVTDGVFAAKATIRVRRLNGLTRARRPDLVATGGSAVAFNPVSSVNPLAVTINNAGVAQAANIIGFTPDNAGDEVGPGTITLDGNVSCNDRDSVFTSDASYIVRAAASSSIDGLGPASTLTAQMIRLAVARLRTMNVPVFSGSGYFHAHVDPTSETELFATEEFQRLNTSLPDYVLYKELVLGTMQGTAFFSDTEAPQAHTVVGQNLAVPVFDVGDPFGGEIFSLADPVAGVQVHRVLFLGQGGLQEYGQDQEELITLAGLTGKIAEFDVSNNGIEVNTDGVKCILRAPQNRTQDEVACTWMWLGSWTFRTDVTTGDAARYKRACVIEHA